MLSGNCICIGRSFRSSLREQKWCLKGSSCLVLTCLWRLSSSTSSVCRKRCLSVSSLWAPLRASLLSRTCVCTVSNYTHTHTVNGLQKCSACKTIMQQEEVIHPAKGLMNCRFKVLYDDVEITWITDIYHKDDYHGSISRSVPYIPWFYIQRNPWFSYFHILFLKHLEITCKYCKSFSLKIVVDCGSLWFHVTKNAPYYFWSTLCKFNEFNYQKYYSITMVLCQKYF